MLAKSCIQSLVATSLPTAFFLLVIAFSDFLSSPQLWVFTFTSFVSTNALNSKFSSISGTMAALTMRLSFDAGSLSKHLNGSMCPGEVPRRRPLFRSPELIEFLCGRDDRFLPFQN